MRYAVLVLLVLVAGCTSAPQPAPPPAVKSAADLAPLGPCPASSWKPEAPPPTASAKVSMVLLAVGEWARFGRQVVVYSTDQPPRTEQQGVKERDAPERIHDYWLSVGYPRADRPRQRAVVGRLHLLGHRQRGRAARSVLPGLAPHDLCRAAGRAGAPAGRRLHRAPALRAGAAGRRPYMRIARRQRHHPRTTSTAAPAHCDIVVEVKPGWVAAIGGNVGRLGQPQRLSTGRQWVFIAHIRPARFHRDRKQIAVGSLR